MFGRGRGSGSEPGNVVRGVGQWWLVGMVAGLSLLAAWWLHRAHYRYEDDETYNRPPAWAVPLVAVAAALVAAVFVSGRPTAVNVVYAVALVWAVVLGFIDLSVRRLPNTLVLPGYPLAAVALTVCSLLTGHWTSLLWAAICAAATFVVYLALALLTRHQEGLGLGDVKMAGVVAGLLGWLSPMGALLGMLTGFILGGVMAGVLLLARRRRDSHLTLGPAILAGAYIWCVLI